MIRGCYCGNSINFPIFQFSSQTSAETKKKLLFTCQQLRLKAAFFQLKWFLWKSTKNIKGHQISYPRILYEASNLSVYYKSCDGIHKYLHFHCFTDSLSIEKGYPHWHQEIRMDDNPFQAGLGFTCKLKTSMPFQGRTALEALKGQGLSKKKVCFTLQDKYVCGIKACFRGRGCAPCSL